MEVYSLVLTRLSILPTTHRASLIQRHLNSFRSIQAWLLLRAHGFSFWQTFVRYPRRYPFILLGGERQSRLSIFPRNANTAPWPVLETVTLSSRAQCLATSATTPSKVEKGKGGKIVCHSKHANRTPRLPPTIVWLVVFHWKYSDLFIILLESSGLYNSLLQTIAECYIIVVL